MAHPSVPIVIYTGKDLASIFKITMHTLLKYVRPLEPLMGPRLGYYFTPKQVGIIVEDLNNRFKPDLKVAKEIVVGGHHRYGSSK